MSRKTIVEFIETHHDAASGLQQWYRVVKQAQWRSLIEVRQLYPHADLVGRRTVFNISGNRVRLIARMNYRIQAVFILHILTHEEYNKEDWKP